MTSGINERNLDAPLEVSHKNHRGDRSDDSRNPNTFPRLPVREDANVFVWFSRFPDREAYDKCAAAAGESMRQREVTMKLTELTKGQSEVLLLSPTPRSLL
jgi:hypothetical protein